MPADPYDRPPPSQGPVRPVRGQGRGGHGVSPARGQRPPGLPMPPPQIPPPAPEFRGPRMMYREARSAGERSRLLPIMVYSVLGLFALVAVGAAFLFLMPPTGLIRDRLVAEVKQRTGR